MPSEPPHRSLLNRVARRVTQVGQRVRDGIHAVRDEARHPGRPQAHMEGRNPLWRTEDDREADRTAPSATYTAGGDPQVDPFSRPKDEATAEGAAWYLEGEGADPGWRQTNPDEDESDS